MSDCKHLWAMVDAHHEQCRKCGECKSVMCERALAERRRIVEIIERHVTGTRFGIPGMMRAINEEESG